MIIRSLRLRPHTGSDCNVGPKLRDPTDMTSGCLLLVTPRDVSSPRQSQAKQAGSASRVYGVVE